MPKVKPKDCLSDLKNGAYTGGRLGHAAHDGDVPHIDLGCTHLFGVGVEPQVVGTVGSEIVLITAQVQVPHPFLFFLYKTNYYN